MGRLVRYGPTYALREVSWSARSLVEEAKQYKWEAEDSDDPFEPLDFEQTALELTTINL